MSVVWNRVKAAAATATSAVLRVPKKVAGVVASVIRAAVAKVTAKVASTRAKVGVVRKALAAAWRVEKILLVALAVGAAAAVATLHPAVTSVLSGAAVTAVFVQAAVWERKVVRDWAEGDATRPGWYARSLPVHRG